MSLVLYSTPTSPFARRIRLLMEPLEVEIQTANFLEPEARKAYAIITPIRKVPVLDDNGTRIYDSHVIQQFVFNKLALSPLSIDESNLISVIDAVLDSLVIVMMSNRSGIEINNDQLIFALQNERIADSLNWLEQQCQENNFTEWNYVTMSLLSLVHWAQFRDLVDFSAYPAIVKVTAQFESLELVQQTMPANP